MSGQMYKAILLGSCCPCARYSAGCLERFIEDQSQQIMQWLYFLLDFHLLGFTKPQNAHLSECHVCA